MNKRIMFMLMASVMVSVLVVVPYFGYMDRKYEEETQVEIAGMIKRVTSTSDSGIEFMIEGNNTIFTAHGNQVEARLSKVGDKVKFIYKNRKYLYYNVMPNSFVNYTFNTELNKS